MVSAVQDEFRGLGFPLTKAQLHDVNGFRDRNKRPALRTSPGLGFMVPRKSRDGYWGYADFEERVVAVMDCFEVVQPDKQLMVEVDHSAGHARFREDGLRMRNMNAKYGGK